MVVFLFWAGADVNNNRADKHGEEREMRKDITHFVRVFVSVVGLSLRREMRKDITHFVRVFVSVVGFSLRHVAHFPRSLL